MNGTFLKWGIPAFLTVVGGTLAAITTSGAAIPPDLEARSRAALADPGHSWAAVRFDAQDAILTGTATSQQMIDEATARIAEVHGVRTVVQNTVLAEYVSPFPFVATVTDGKLTLSGGLPDEAARAEVLAVAGKNAIDNTRLMSGAPDRAQWVAAARYAVEQATKLDEGEVALADLALTIAGRASTSDAYNQLKTPPAAPQGVSRGFSEIEPPLVSPFEWHAQFDGARLTLSGATPSESLAASLTALAPAGVTVESTLAPASGAPAGFDAAATLLVQNLLKLESGSAKISDTTSALDGVPADPAAAESVRIAMTPAGAELNIGAPRVSEYWLSAERTEAGIVLDGFVPDVAMRDRLEKLDNVDASGLDLGRGAPEPFESAVDFALDALKHLSTGHATIQGTVITIDGRATTLRDYEAVKAALDKGSPTGAIFGEATIALPLATPFTFSAEKSADGRYALTGYIPGGDTHEALRTALPGLGADRLVLADGSPEGFEDQVLKAIKVLAQLDRGKVAYDGKAWSITGNVSAASKGQAAAEAFAATGLEAAGWTYQVALPAAPVIDPYVWRAQKSADGSLVVSGFVPTDIFKNRIAELGGPKLTDTTSIGAGAPDSFVPDASAALDALLAMDEGSVAFNAGNWTVSGKVAEAEQRHAIEAKLSAATETSGWHVAVQAANAAPVVSPFTWSATKSADGSIALSGYVPTDALRATIAERAGEVSKDGTLVGSGEPAGFEADALAGLSALASLESGKLDYDGTAWSFAGQPATPEDAEAARTTLGDAATRWTVAIAEPTQPTEPAPTPEPEIAETPEPPAEPAVEVADVPPQPEAVPAAPVTRNYVFDVSKVIGEPVVLQGAVPAEPMRRFLAVLTNTEPNESLRIDAGMPADFIPNAEAGTRALMLLADGRLGFDSSKWVLSGRAESDAARTAALAELAPLGGGSWETDVTLLPPLLVCEEHVTTFQARNAILFESGSARIAEASLPAIDELAGYLAACPEATINVEGHTDADGEADANLALSVLRAEAVVDALILRNVAPERLYAVGYGESVPIATNDTRAGKQANRRIAFTLSDQ